jgi:biopolymer transport protein ExbD
VVIEAERLTLNGRALPLDALAEALGPLMETPEDIVVLRPAEGVPLARLIEVRDALAAAGLGRLMVVE